MEKFFLGDGGAYFLGHLLVWSSIFLINHDPSISSFAILLIFFGPLQIPALLSGGVLNSETLPIGRPSSLSSVSDAITGNSIFWP